MSWLLLTLLLGQPAPVSPAAARGPTPFELSGLNRVYEDMVDHLDPWQQGAMTVKLRSPHQRLTLHGHRVWLRPTTQGRWLVSLDLDFEAEGDILADLEIGLIRQSLEDKIVVPRQERSLRGEVEITSLREGYRITTRRLPSHFRIRVESRLSDSLIKTCRQLSYMPLLSLDCDSFASSLSELEIELPAAGSSYLLPAGDLTLRERAFFDALLATVQKAPAVDQP